MTGEGRRSEVKLLDGRRVELIIQPKLFAGDLFDIVASHFNLKEKEYFGLAFLDQTCQYSWLNLDKRVLEHEYARKNSHKKLILHFLVKYFVESITQLNDRASVELFYLQAKTLVANEVIQVDTDTIFLLAALVLQSTYSNFINESTTRSYLKKLHLIPTYILKELPSLQVCEDNVIGQYEQLRGQSRGDVVIKYMSIIEKQPTYGVHFYEIKDKTGILYWLGLSYKGINQFDYNDRRIPRQSFLWKQLENLYFREKKFSIEVRDPKRVVHTLSSINLYENVIEESVDTIDDLSTAITDPTTQVSVSRRTFGPCNVTVYVWFAASSALTKCIWSMAIAQHQFYIDRRNSNKNSVSTPRTLEEIKEELDSNTVSLSSSVSLRSGNFSIQRSLSSHSLPTLRIEDEELNQLETNKVEKQKQMFETLKVRKEALEEAMNKKLAELKSLCLKEGELTGELPPETPLDSNERIPQIRRRVGTAFTLNDKLLLKPKTKEEEILSKLQLEYEIQSKIVSAASKLAKDTTAKKTVRKQRKHAYQQALAKMKDLEAKLLKVKHQISISRRQQSTEDLNEDNISHSTDESQERCENTLNKFFVTERTNKQMVMTRSASLYSSSVPSTPNKFSSDKQSSRVRPLSPSIVSLANKVNVIQRPRSAAAKSEPTFEYDTDEESNEVLRNLEDKTSSVGSSSGGNNSVIFIGGEKNKSVLLESPYVNKFEATLNDDSNLYSVPNRRTSIALKSQDDTHLRHNKNILIKDQFIVNKSHKDLQNEDNPQLLRSNSLDNSHRRGTASQIPNDYNSGTESPSIESHHKHYLNHYPTYRMTRTPELPEMSPAKSPMPSVQQSCHLAQRPLPTLPVSDVKTKFIQTVSVQNNANHSVCQMSPRVDRYAADFTDSVPKNYRQFPNSRFIFEDTISDNFSPVSSRSVTPSQFSSNVSSTEFHPSNPNTSSQHNTYPPPQTQKTPKTWTETSLDFVLPTKTNKFSTQMTVNSGPDSQSMSQSIGGRPPNITNLDSTNELYVNIIPLTVITSVFPPTPISPVTTLSPQSQSTLTTLSSQQPNPPMCSPQPPFLPSHTMSANNRNSIASTTKSIGGESVSSKPSSIPLSPTIPSGNGVEVTVVSVGHFQPYWEEEKPFEMEDFYKYSQKHRNSQQQMVSPVVTNHTDNSDRQETNHPLINGSQSVESTPASVQSPNSSLLNDSFKTKAVVSDAFTNELMDWYEDREVVPKDKDKKIAILV